MERQDLIEAMKEAFAPAVHMQMLAAKAALTPKEVETLYGISADRLNRMRIADRGPKYTQLAKNGSVLYTHDAISKWLQLQSVAPRTV